MGVLGWVLDPVEGLDLAVRVPVDLPAETPLVVVVVDLGPWS